MRSHFQFYLEDDKVIHFPKIKGYKMPTYTVDTTKSVALTQKPFTPKQHAKNCHYLSQYRSQ